MKKKPINTLIYMRLPPDVIELLKQLAEANCRSLPQEVTFRVLQSIREK